MCVVEPYYCPSHNPNNSWPCQDDTIEKRFCIEMTLLTQLQGRSNSRENPHRFHSLEVVQFPVLRPPPLWLHQTITGISKTAFLLTSQRVSLTVRQTSWVFSSQLFSKALAHSSTSFSTHSKSKKSEMSTQNWPSLLCKSKSLFRSALGSSTWELLGKNK